MKRMSFPGMILAALVLLAAAGFAADAAEPCRVCGEHRADVVLQYHDGTADAFCSLRCAVGSMAAYREKDVTGIRMRDHDSGEMIDAKQAFWVVALSGKGRSGAHRAPAVFRSKESAERFAASSNGRVQTYAQAMAAIVSGLYQKIAETHREIGKAGRNDITAHPECVYCGMDRKKYSYSRMLLEYDDGSAVGLCSIHCAAIDLALKPRAVPTRIMVGAYDTGKLIDAEQAVWVLGGSKQGVMSIRGKWAFEKENDAQGFIREFGGGLAGFADVMKAAYEDMWEILR